MKTNNTKKTLKAAIAALGLAAVLSVPGCATTVATCTVTVLNPCA